ncbi:zinc ribbon domain-containing protein [Chloroflexota bacterium]
MSVVRQLYYLQLVDSEWDERAERLAEVKAQLGESEDLVRAREAVGETERDREKLVSNLRPLELEIGGLDAKLKVNQDRLYSGRVRNPKELSNLQEEATALSRRRSQLEDEQLELLISIEENEAEQSERQARLRQIEATWSDDQSALAAGKGQLEERLSELDDERVALRRRIPEVDLVAYDDLRERLAGTAIALLKGGICQVCGVDVPTRMAMAVDRGEGQNFCPVCNRILLGGG